MESRYYKEITEQFPSSKEVNDLIEKWKTLSENIGTVKPELPVLLPDYLLSAANGAGKSTLFRLMANYLEETELMHFQGDRKVIEYYLEYCRPEEEFSELGRFNDKIRQAAGYHDKFCGIVAVDCSEWKHHFEERYMRMMLEYLMDNSNEWLIFIIVDTFDEDELAAIESAVSDYLRINTLKLNYPEPEEMKTYLFNKVDAYGLTLSDDAQALLSDTLSALSAKKHFAGYWTLDLLAQEIIYSIYSEKKGVPKTITAKMLGEFSKDGSFVKHAVETYNNRKSKIGF